MESTADKCVRESERESRLTHQGYMDCKFHTNAHWSNEDDHGYGAKLDANQPHHAE